MDDAVFSVGEFLCQRPGTLIISPFAGLPDDDVGHAKYTRLYAEHERVMRAIKADWLNGPFLDDVYAATRDITGLQEWIHGALVANNVHEVWVPYGIFHVDHLATANAALAAAHSLQIGLCIYEELPYRVLWPEQVRRVRLGLATLMGPALDLDRKKELCAMYASQTKGDDIHRCLYAPERVWRVS